MIFIVIFIVGLVIVFLYGLRWLRARYHRRYGTGPYRPSKERVSDCRDDFITATALLLLMVLAFIYWPF